MRSRSRFLSACLVLVLASPLVGLALPATSEGGFTATLSSEQKTQAGITTLTPAENTALDLLIAGEIARARRESVTAFEGNFSARLDAAQRKASGLDRLTAPELARLDELIATAVASGPKPKERPRLRDEDVIIAPKPEIHGEVSLAYGWSGGGQFRAASLRVDYFDPKSRIGLSIGVSNVSGDGFYPAYYGYPGDRYYYNSPFGDIFDGPFHRPWRDDFYSRDDDFYRPSDWRDGNGRRSFRRY